MYIYYFIYPNFFNKYLFIQIAGFTNLFFCGNVEINTGKWIMSSYNCLKGLGIALAPPSWMLGELARSDSPV